VNNATAAATAAAATAPTPSVRAGRAFKKLTLPEYGYCPRCRREVKLPELPGRGRVPLCPYCGGPLRVLPSLRRRRLQRALPAAPALEEAGSYATHYYCANCKKWVPHGNELRDSLGRPLCPVCLRPLRARRRRPKRERGWGT
jgi:DNA-directed RNA polymerase subunit RPC12/RpoP